MQPPSLSLKRHGLSKSFFLAKLATKALWQSILNVDHARLLWITLAIKNERASLCDIRAWMSLLCHVCLWGYLQRWAIGICDRYFGIWVLPKVKFATDTKLPNDYANLPKYWYWKLGLGTCAIGILSLFEGLESFYIGFFMAFWTPSKLFFSTDTKIPNTELPNELLSKLLPKYWYRKLGEKNTEIPNTALFYTCPALVIWTLNVVKVVTKAIHS